MLEFIVILFLLTAAAGLGLAVRVYRTGRGSRLAYAHGLAGLVAVALLLARAFGGPLDMGLNAAALLFCIAAVGGLLLFTFSMRREAPPFPFVALHGGVALVALVVLLLSVLPTG